MSFRTVVASLLIGGLALGTAACGKSGNPPAPGGAAAAIEPPPAMEIVQNPNISGSATFDRIKQKGRITIGVKDDQPGIGLKDPTTGKYSGFDVDIALYLAGQLGYSADKVDFKPVPSSSREAALSGGQVDYLVASYTINDKRKAQVGFAGPYFVAGQDLLVRKDENGITGPDSLQGKKVCSVTGSTPIQNVREKKLTDQVVELQKYSDCVTQLLNKQVDALTTDDAILKGYAAQDPTKLKVVGKPFTKEPYGVGLNKADTVLRGKFDDFLDKALGDGTWQKFYDQTLGKSGAKVSKPTVQRY